MQQSLTCTCPCCSADFQFELEHQGAELDCPHCKKRIKLPSSADFQVEAPLSSPAGCRDHDGDSLEERFLQGDLHEGFENATTLQGAGVGAFVGTLFTAFSGFVLFREGWNLGVFCFFAFSCCLLVMFLPKFVRKKRWGVLQVIPGVAVLPGEVLQGKIILDLKRPAKLAAIGLEAEFQVLTRTRRNIGERNEYHYLSYADSSAVVSGSGGPFKAGRHEIPFEIRTPVYSPDRAKAGAVGSVLKSQQEVNRGMDLAELIGREDTRWEIRACLFDRSRFLVANSATLRVGEKWSRPSLT